MRIGLLVLSVGNFGNKGFYNLQEVGLAKAFGKDGHTVEIFKCTGRNTGDRTEIIADNIRLHLMAVPTIGSNSVFSCEKRLPSDLDALICFSDIQLGTSRVYRWAKRHGIPFLPYTGITHSTSTSALKRALSRFIASGVFRTYRKSGVFAKTTAVENELRAKGIKNVKTVPVGLDFDLLRNEYDVPAETLRSALGLDPALHYYLMVGRLESDRNPLDVLPVFRALRQADEAARLLVIGKGSLKQALATALEADGSAPFVTWIEQVPNCDMWKYYRASNALVSFSKTEIFGMSILEAMYYELPVYVIHAPGPDEIMIDGETGFLFDTPEDMAASIKDAVCPNPEMGARAHRRIVSRFSWEHMVNAVMTLTETAAAAGSKRNGSEE